MLKPLLHSNGSKELILYGSKVNAGKGIPVYHTFDMICLNFKIKNTLNVM